MDLRPAEIVVVDLDGMVVEGDLRPSSEIRMHLRIYARRRDAQAVVHAHPPTATGFGVAGEDLTAAVLPEVILQMGRVPLVPYQTPGTEAVADALDPLLALEERLPRPVSVSSSCGRRLPQANQDSVENSLSPTARSPFRRRKRVSWRSAPASQSADCVD